jgi:hypothetical protein
MQTAWSQVESLLNELRPLLVEAGIQEHQVKMPTGREVDEIPIPQYVKAFDWLHELKISREWEVLLAAKALLPQLAWDNYKALGMRGLREQVILESAQLAIRKAWKDKRPSFFGRHYKPKKQDDNA